MTRSFEKSFRIPKGFKCGECDKASGYKFNPLLGRCGEGDRGGAGVGGAVWAGLGRL